jgi:hypothetical protein
MMSRSIVFMLLLWLPLQGVAALTMPFCRHALDAAVEQAAHGRADAEHAHHAHDHGTPADQPRPGDRQGGLSCNDCGACNLACAAVMLPAPVLGTLAAVAGRPHVAPPLAPPAFVLDRPYPPPLMRG